MKLAKALPMIEITSKSSDDIVSSQKAPFDWSYFRHAPDRPDVVFYVQKGEQLPTINLDQPVDLKKISALESQEADTSNYVVIAAKELGKKNRTYNLAELKDQYEDNFSNLLRMANPALSIYESTERAKTIICNEWNVQDRKHLGLWDMITYADLGGISALVATQAANCSIGTGDPTIGYATTIGFMVGAVMFPLAASMRIYSSSADQIDMNKGKIRPDAEGNKNVSNNTRKALNARMIKMLSAAKPTALAIA